MVYNETCTWPCRTCLWGCTMILIIWATLAVAHHGFGWGQVPPVEDGVTWETE